MTRPFKSPCSGTLLLLLNALLAVEGSPPLESQARAALRLPGYGFITRFNVSEEKARAVVRQLYSDFGIVDFQFYDAFENYSHPFPANYTDFGNATWISKPSTCFAGTARAIRASAIAAYTDEIRRLPVHGGGRSWLYVQAVAADEHWSDLRGGMFAPYVYKNGEQVTWTKDKPCLFVYQPTVAWAERQLELWGPAAAAFGFYGVHWDQLGRISDDDEQNAMLASNFRDFLHHTGTQLSSKYGLKQTMNFVNGFGWHPDLYQLQDPSKNVVEFPYWECWSDDTEWIFWSLFNFSGRSAFQPGAVFARYPDPSCCGNAPGATADSLMWSRWQRAASACNRYLVLGDGRQRLVDEYFPRSAALSDFEHAAMAYASQEGPSSCAMHAVMEAEAMGKPYDQIHL